MKPKFEIDELSVARNILKKIDEGNLCFSKDELTSINRMPAGIAALLFTNLIVFIQFNTLPLVVTILLTPFNIAGCYFLYRYVFWPYFSDQTENFIDPSYISSALKEEKPGSKLLARLKNSPLENLNHAPSVPVMGTFIVVSLFLAGVLFSLSY